jgi:hypothetical protein
MNITWQAQMDSRTKSDILRELSESIDAEKDCFIECRLKKIPKILRIDLKIEDQKIFIDKEGIRWVRE